MSPRGYQFLTVITNDGSACLRCTTNGAVAVKTLGKFHFPYQQGRSVLFNGISGPAEAAYSAWQHECKEGCDDNACGSLSPEQI